MKNFFKKIINLRFFWLILLILIALPTFWRLLGPGYFSMHDDLQIGRLYEMDLCLRDGQIPCRWVPDMGYGYGYPLFNYYPPLPYYLGLVFHLLGFSYIYSIKILFILGLVFSAVFAYLLGKELWGKYGGMVTAVFYLYAPYHAVDVYVRGALNEFWGLVLFPAVFWAVLKIIKENKKIFMAALAFFFSLLLLSHNLMAFFIVPFLIVWALFLIFYLKKPKKVIWPLLKSGLWGVALAAFFTLPVLFERNLAHIETMFIGYFNYLAHFADLKQLFLSRFWGFGPSSWGPGDDMAFPLGQVHWIVGTIIAIIFGILFLKKRKRESFLVFFFFVFFLLTAFLTHQRSNFIWERISLLATFQFPWRFLALSTFFLSMLSGAVFLLIKKEKQALLLAFLMIIAVFAFNISFFKPERIVKITDEEKLFSAKGWQKLQTDAIFDYLPIYAEKPPGEPASENPLFEEGEGVITEYRKGTDWLEFKAKIESEEGKIRIPVFYFPNWTVLVDSQVVDFTYDNEFALLDVNLKQGDYGVKVFLRDTPVRTISNLISFFSWIGLIVFLIKNKRS